MRFCVRARGEPVAGAVLCGEDALGRGVAGHRGSTLVPTRAHTVAEQSKDYRQSTNHQVVIEADTRLVVAVGRPVTNNRHGGKAWELSGARLPSAGPRSSRTAAVEAPACSSRPAVKATSPNCQRGKRSTTASHRKVRFRVEHAFARMKAWKILRDCRLNGDGVHAAVLGIARLHNLALTG